MKKMMRGAKTNLATAGELFSFFMKRKLWWLVPMLAVLILFALLLVFAHSSGVGALIYPLF